jgi:hypothetical protein
VVLSVDGKEFFQDIRVISDPNVPPQNELTASLEEAYEVWMGDDVREDGDEEEEEQAERERQRDLGGEG